jgi:hypothetical protein
MWEDILTKDMVLYLLDNFIFVQKEAKKDSETKQKKIDEKIIFPRYHQLNAVRRLTFDIKENRTEKNYLVQHSAGSGKTNTISWLAHRLASLYDKNEKEIFKTIIIITDRIVVDRQLQDAVLAKEKMEALLDKSLRLVYKHPTPEQYEIRASIRGFLRFYCFLIQATSFEDIDLHKKYNFLSYLIKEIEITSGGNDFDIADKITVTFRKPKKSGEVKQPEWVAEPEIEYPIPGEIIVGPDERKRLSQIIEEINAKYNKNLITDVAIKAALQVKDILMKDEKLKASAKTNTLKDFHFTYNDSVDGALVDGYDQNEDFYSLLLNNDDLKKSVMSVFIEDVYKTLKKEKQDIE